MGLDTLEAIRTRRVAQNYAETPVPEKDLWTILEAARWAPTAGNRRIHRFVCVNDRSLLLEIKMFFPGMTHGLPAALIVICIDTNTVIKPLLNIGNSYEPYIDVGVAAQNMLLAAHALGLVAGPMTSFSNDAMQVLLNLPDNINPHMCIGVGYHAELPAHTRRWPKKKLRVEDLVQWGPYPD